MSDEKMVETLESIKTMEGAIARDRERLTAELADIERQEEQLAARRHEIQGMMDKVGALEAVLEGRVSIRGVQKPRARKPSSGQRAPRGQKRGEILDLIRQHEGGLSSGEIIDILGMRGDKKGSQSINNILANMKKAGQLEKSGERGSKYIAVGE